MLGDQKHWNHIGLASLETRNGEFNAGIWISNGAGSSHLFLVPSTGPICSCPLIANLRQVSFSVSSFLKGE